MHPRLCPISFQRLQKSASPHPLQSLEFPLALTPPSPLSCKLDKETLISLKLGLLSNELIGSLLPPEREEIADSKFLPELQRLKPYLKKKKIIKGKFKANLKNPSECEYFRKLLHL